MSTIQFFPLDGLLFHKGSLHCFSQFRCRPTGGRGSGNRGDDCDSFRSGLDHGFGIVAMNAADPDDGKRGVVHLGNSTDTGGPDRFTGIRFGTGGIHGADSNIIGAGLGCLVRFFRIAAGNAEHGLGSQQAAYLNGRQILLAYMDTVGVQYHGQVSAVIYNEGNPLPGTDIPQFFTEEYSLGKGKR